MSETRKLIESLNQEPLKENGLYCETLQEFKDEVNKQGGLYGFVSNKYNTLPIELLKEIALNALYELNNDEQVISDIAERYYEDNWDEKASALESKYKEKYDAYVKSNPNNHLDYAEWIENLPRNYRNEIEKGV